jgi:hypothetical protein
MSHTGIPILLLCVQHYKTVVYSACTPGSLCNWAQSKIDLPHMLLVPFWYQHYLRSMPDSCDRRRISRYLPTSLSCAIGKIQHSASRDTRLSAHLTLDNPGWPDLNGNTYGFRPVTISTVVLSDPICIFGLQFTHSPAAIKPSKYSHIR